MKKKKAFTLAEVLITLMIIGIVAALTIPSVISNYQQQEFKTGLKKAVSVLNEAIQINIAQDGETPYENGDLFGYLQRHMNVLKTFYYVRCLNKTTGEHMASLEDENADCYRNGGDSMSNYTFYTTDGMRFEFAAYGIPALQNIRFHETGLKYSDAPAKLTAHGTQKNYCGSYGLGSNPNNTKYSPCIIVVDVNGDKKPNPPGAGYEKDREIGVFANGQIETRITPQPFDYIYPAPTDKKVTDVFSIMITEDRAIPFGVVAQRAMYSK